MNNKNDGKIRYKSSIFLLLVLVAIFFNGCKKQTVIMQDQETFELDASDVSKDAEEQTEEDSAYQEVPSGDGKNQKEQPEADEEECIIRVHVCGAVNCPDVYELPKNSRVIDAVKMAGGFQKEAGQDGVNLASELSDGMRVRIPTKEEILAQSEQIPVLSTQTEETSLPGQNETQEQRVNINTADETELMTLPGIGSARAKSIIEYRSQHGSFQTIEDIMKVSGIKEAAYTKMKEKITV